MDRSPFPAVDMTVKFRRILPAVYTVWAERGGGDVGAMHEGLGEGLAGARVPGPGGVVEAGGDDARAVWAERGGDDGVAMLEGVCEGLARTGLEAVDELRLRGVQIADLEHIALNDPPRLLATPWTPSRDRLVGQLQRLFAAAVL